MSTKGPTRDSGSLFVHPNQIVRAVQGEEQIVPVRQFKVLFPIWNVNVVGKQREGREYELMERFIERGIEYGELHSIQELAFFFKLPTEMLRKMVEFLRSTGHLEDAGTDGQLRLTPLGKDSLKAEQFYRSLETHRTLHFEAFGSRPLLREHYDLPFQDQAQASRLKDRSIYRLYSEASYDFQGRLEEIKHDPDRAQKYNLPDEVELTNQIKQMTIVFAPLSIIEALEYRGGDEAGRGKRQFETRFLVMSRIEGWRDRFFEEVVHSEPRIAYELKAQALQYTGEQTEKTLQEWIEGRLAGRGKSERLENGDWRVVLEEGALKGKNRSERLRLADLGEFNLVRGYFFQLWCADADIRREASMEQTLVYLERQVRAQRLVSQDYLQDFLARAAGNLEVEEGSWEEFEEYADRRGKGDLLDEVE